MALGLFNLMSLHELYELGLQGIFPIFLFTRHCGEIVIASGKPSVWQHVKDVMISKRTA